MPTSLKCAYRTTSQPLAQLAISVAQLAAHGDVRSSLFWVTTRDGAVTGIAEQFLP